MYSSVQTRGTIAPRRTEVAELGALATEVETGEQHRGESGAVLGFPSRGFRPGDVSVDADESSDLRGAQSSGLACLSTGNKFGEEELEAPYTIIIHVIN